MAFQRVTPRGPNSPSFSTRASDAGTGFQYGFGAVVQGDGMVRFRLWAPQTAQVTLEIQGRLPVTMLPVGQGYHQLILSCPVGAAYKFRVAGDIVVPDPASRLQAGDVDDFSIVSDPGAYRWRHSQWQGRPWCETVLYEIHCGLAGGFGGVEQRLPELVRLGVTAIELMPIADFPGPRNWGYDGVLPYAPDCAYGTPEQLKHLIDTAHGMGLMVFLDVVYNHFGPAGNYLPLYAPEFFRDDILTPWGSAIDFRQLPVRQFFAENALYWLQEYRFDGLRLDAVHTITSPDWLVEMAAFVRSHLDGNRHVHLVLESEENAPWLIEQGFDAQWNDDAHHVLHHILTGETQGYYAAYADHVTDKLACVLENGFVDQSLPNKKDDLAPTSFVFFLQNHDQVGNRALGERLVTLVGSNYSLLRAAIALQMLTPHIPLLFMGEEYGVSTPFQYFTSYADPGLAKAVREGRRSEFEAFHEFSSPWQQAAIPDPNVIGTWENSFIGHQPYDAQAASWYEWYSQLLAIRRVFISPFLYMARSAGVRIIAPLCVHARWLLDGQLLSIYCNFSRQACRFPDDSPTSQDTLLFSSTEAGGDSLSSGVIPAACTLATLRPAAFTESVL